VLVYATGTEHPLRAHCRALVGAAGAGTDTATTTVEVLQEFMHVRARRRSRAAAASLTAAFADLLSPLLVVDEQDLRAGTELFRHTDDLGAFDAVPAAVDRNRSADALVSADRAFGGVAGLCAVVPDAEGTAGLLDR
jgi:predicted nucleic acid-binding protein